MRLMFRFLGVGFLVIFLTACPKITLVDVYMKPITDNEKSIIPYVENQQVQYSTESGDVSSYISNIEMDTLFESPVRCGMIGGGKQDVYHYYQYKCKLKSEKSTYYEIQYGISNLHKTLYTVQFLNSSISKQFYFRNIDSLKSCVLQNFNNLDSVLYVSNELNTPQNKVIHDTLFLHRKKGILGWSFEGKGRWFLKE